MLDALDLPICIGAGIQSWAEKQPAWEDSRALGYEGAEDSHRRKQVAPRIVSEDDVLDASKRRKLQANALDIHRNFAIAAWAIRKHLDFCTSFKFASNNAQQVIGPDADAAAQTVQAERSQLDDDIEGVITEASDAENCDTAARHDLPTMLRLCEARATIAGDQGFIELQDGTMQAIESDRVLTPRGEKDAVHGVRLDARGRSVAYAIHSRAKNGYQFERWVPAANMVWRGYYDRFDQVRGISPMAPALNSLRDLHEGFVYALAKAKIAQLFGFKTMRNAEHALNQAFDEETDRPTYGIDLGKGPWNIDLERGDDIEIMQAEVPGTSFESFSEMMIAISLLAIDLPWNFYKVDATNFFGSRAALNLYLKSSATKRRANVSILRRWTRRQLQFAVLRGKLRLPRTMTVNDLRWSWTPDGMPWWNPSQEADGAGKSISMGLDNPQDIALATGSNYFRNIDKTSECIAYAKSKGVPLNFAGQTQFTIAPTNHD